jgi:hypothetical protein
MFEDIIINPPDNIDAPVELDDSDVNNVAQFKRNRCMSCCFLTLGECDASEEETGRCIEIAKDAIRKRNPGR